MLHMPTALHQQERRSQARADAYRPLHRKNNYSAKYAYPLPLSGPAPGLRASLAPAATREQRWWPSRRPPPPPPPDGRIKDIATARYILCHNFPRWGLRYPLPVCGPLRRKNNYSAKYAYPLPLGPGSLLYYVVDVRYTEVSLSVLLPCCHMIEEHQTTTRSQASRSQELGGCKCSTRRSSRGSPRSRFGSTGGRRPTPQGRP